MDEDPKAGSARAVDAALLAVALLAGAAVRIFPAWPVVFRGGRVVFLESDPYYHLRRIQYAVRHFPDIPDFDAYVNFPGGAPIIWPPGFDLLLAFLARLMAGAGPDAVERLCAFAIPVFGLAAIGAVYLLARQSLDRPGAGIAALTFALLPIPITYSLLGRVDHHVLEPCFMALAAAALMASWRGPTGRAVVLAASGGVLAALSAAFVTDAPVMLALLSAVAAWEGVRGRRRGSVAAALAFVSAATLTLLPLAAATPWGRSGTMTYLALSPLHTHLAVAGLGLTLAVVVGARRAAPRPARVLGVAAGLALLAGSFLHGGEQLLEPLREAGKFLFRLEGVVSTVRESKPLWRDSPRDILLLMTPMGIATPAILLAAWFRGRGTVESRAALLGLAFFALGVAQVRFMGFGGVAIAWAAGWVASRVWRVAPGTAGQQWVRPGFVLLLLACLVGSLKITIEWARKLGPPPADLATAQALRPLRDPESDLDRPQRSPRWGVLGPWDLGHLLIYRSGMPVVSSPFGQASWHIEGVRRVVRFNLSETDAAATDLARRLRVRYVVTRDPLVTVFSDAAVVGIPLDRFMRADRRRDNEVVTSPFFLRTSGFRLHALDGRRVRNTSMDVPAMPSFRLVWESEALDPSGMSPLGLPPGWRPSAYKLFEVVAGARVEGRCRPGEPVRIIAPVRTNTGRSFDWVDETLCSAAGSYGLRTPTPGDAIRLVSGGREERIAITRDQVRAGGVVRADVVKDQQIAQPRLDRN